MRPRQFEMFALSALSLSNSPLLSEQREVLQPAPRLRCSALPGIETPLPQGLNPISLLQDATGSLIVGDLLHERRTDAERTVRGSLAFIQTIASALPTNAEDERIVDALVANSTAALPRRSLRRR